MKVLLAVVAIGAVVFVFWPRYPPPTGDDLYGCTVQQQAPNGDCK